MFENYETTIRHVIELQQCPPEVTPSEFQLFRANFGGHAYLCRFVSCVHATIGFTSNEQRLAHESGHILSFPCSESGCQYPPFGSQQALKRHLSETHEKGKTKRSVTLSLKPISKPVPQAGGGLTPSSINPYTLPCSIPPNSTNRLAVMQVHQRSLKTEGAQARQQFIQAVEAFLEGGGGGSGGDRPTLPDSTRGLYEACKKQEELAAKHAQKQRPWQYYPATTGPASSL